MRIEVVHPQQKRQRRRDLTAQRLERCHGDPRRGNGVVATGVRFIEDVEALIESESASDEQVRHHRQRSVARVLKDLCECHPLPGQWRLRTDRSVL